MYAHIAALALLTLLPVAIDNRTSTANSALTESVATSEKWSAWTQMNDGLSNGLDYRVKTNPNEFMDSGYCTTLEIRSRYVTPKSFDIEVWREDGTSSTHFMYVSQTRTDNIIRDTRRIVRYSISNLRDYTPCAE